MAPEVINSSNYTIKADVFSFGIVLWEICSREPPYKSYIFIILIFFILFQEILKKR